jgi:hypothetical protein
MPAGRPKALATLIAELLGVTPSCVRLWRAEGAPLENGSELVTWLLGRGMWGHSVLDNYPIGDPVFCRRLERALDRCVELSQTKNQRAAHKKPSGDTTTADSSTLEEIPSPGVGNEDCHF